MVRNTVFSYQYDRFDLFEFTKIPNRQNRKLFLIESICANTTHSFNRYKTKRKYKQ